MNVLALKCKMLERSVSQKKLAELLKISKSALHRKMIMNTQFTQSEILKISDILELSNEEIVSIFFDKKVS